MKYILFFVLFFPIFIFSQTDTVFQLYPTHNVQESVIAETIILEDGNYCMLELSRGDKDFVLIAEQNGQLIHKTFIDTLSGFDLISCNSIFELDSSLLFICNAEKNGVNYSIAISSTKDLVLESVLDSVPLPFGHGLSFNWFKYNETKQKYEGFGMQHDFSWNIYDHCYLGFDILSKKLEYKCVQDFPDLTWIEDFIYVPSKDVYLIFTFNDGNWVVSGDVEYLHQLNFLYNFEYNNISYINNYKAYSLHQNSDTSLICFGKSLHDTPHKYNVIEFDFTVGNDTAEIVNITALNDPPIDIWTVPTMGLGKEKEVVVAGVDFYSQTIVPNKITAIKLDSNRNKIWTVEFEQPHTQFLISQTKIDSEGSAIIVGEAHNYFGNSAAIGFLLKIYKDGNFTVSYSEPTIAEYSVGVFPNPTSGGISFSFGKNKIWNLYIYDMFGKLINQKHSSKDLLQFDLTGFANAPYHYVIYGDGKFIQSGIFLKH